MLAKGAANEQYNIIPKSMTSCVIKGTPLTLAR